MESPIPGHAERVTLRRETAWLWKTALGWTVFEWPYQFDLENIEHDGKGWHTIDGRSHSREAGEFEGWLIRYEEGSLDRDAFLEIAERCREVLWKKDQRPNPPTA